MNTNPKEKNTYTGNLSYKIPVTGWYADPSYYQKYLGDKTWDIFGQIIAVGGTKRF